MERFIMILKVVLLGIVEGISEWLPISSTGHMLLIDEFINLEMSSSFKEMFFVVIQLGAILAVLVLFWNKINPFNIKKGKKMQMKKDVFLLWEKTIIACIPGAIITIFFDEFIETYLHSPIVISIMLVLYGIAFIFVEKIKGKVAGKINSIADISFKHAFYVGLFQVLSIIPGTSRSGSTILGSLLIGINRSVAAEFTFYLAIPVMFGLSFIKLVQFGFVYTLDEILVLMIGAIVSFLVSVLVIKFLLSYIKKHDFKIFGIYRIVLGIILFVYFFLIIN